MVVLHRLQQFFSYTMATAHIIHVLPGFHQHEAGDLKCLAQGHSHKQEGQDGPGSLTWIFEITLANFFLSL